MTVTTRAQADRLAGLTQNNHPFPPRLVMEGVIAARNASLCGR